MGGDEHGVAKNYIEIKTPFGFVIKFGGRELFSVVIMSLCVAVIGVMLHQHDAAAQSQAIVVIKALDENRETVRKSLQENKDTTEALIYVLTLSDAEKKSLGLIKPKRLRELERRDY
jgi:hypothetical protein